MERLPRKPVEGTPFQQVFENTPALRQSFLQMDAALKAILEPELLERLRLRSAENNDCNYGQSFQYVALDEQLTEREKLALELTDQIMAYHGKLPEEMYQRLKSVFSKEEIIALLWQIGSKNAGNWFLIAMNIEAQA